MSAIKGFSAQKAKQKKAKLTVNEITRWGPCNSHPGEPAARE